MLPNVAGFSRPILITHLAFNNAKSLLLKYATVPRDLIRPSFWLEKWVLRRHVRYYALRYLLLITNLARWWRSYRIRVLLVHQIPTSGLIDHNVEGLCDHGNYTNLQTIDGIINNYPYRRYLNHKAFEQTLPIQRTPKHVGTGVHRYLVLTAARNFLSVFHAQP